MAVNLGRKSLMLDQQLLLAMMLLTILCFSDKCRNLRIICAAISSISFPYFFPHTTTLQNYKRLISATKPSSSNIINKQYAFASQGHIF